MRVNYHYTYFGAGFLETRTGLDVWIFPRVSLFWFEFDGPAAATGCTACFGIGMGGGSGRVSWLPDVDGDGRFAGRPRVGRLPTWASSRRWAILQLFQFKLRVRGLPSTWQPILTIMVERDALESISNGPSNLLSRLSGLAFLTYTWVAERVWSILLAV